jgi:hypothetical protein
VPFVQSVSVSVRRAQTCVTFVEWREGFQNAGSVAKPVVALV